MTYFRTFLIAFVAVTFFSVPAPSFAADVATSQNDFRAVAKEAIPAVVSIKVKGPGLNEDEDEDDATNSLGGEDFWQRFFGIPQRGGKSQKEQAVVGQASGFIVSPDGYILTNGHVVKDMTEITVIRNDGKEYKAKVIGQDPNTDIALIKIDAQDLPYLKLGNSSDLEVGQWVGAIGAPLGFQASLTVGVVSAKGRNNLDLTRIEDYIQTDAAINRGNSGGPLLNLDGQVIGMNTAIVTTASNGGYMGIGFAIPSNILKVVMDDFKTSGKFTRGYVGVVLQQVDENLAQSFGLSSTQGALVAEVAKDSPAEKAGLKQGDVIVKINKQPVTDVGALRNDVSLMKPGTKIDLEAIRGGKKQNFTVEIGSFPSSAVASKGAQKVNQLGLQVETLTSDMASKLGYSNDKGVVITSIDANSPLLWAGVRKGALILQINHQKVSNVEEFNEALKSVEKDKPVLFLIKQGETTRYVSLKIG